MSKRRGRESGGRGRASVDHVVFFRGRLPSGTEIGERGYHGKIYGAEYEDLAYKGLRGTLPHIAGPSTQPLVHATRCAFLTCVVTNFTLLYFTLLCVRGSAHVCMFVPGWFSGIANVVASIVDFAACASADDAFAIAAFASVTDVVVVATVWLSRIASSMVRMGWFDCWLLSAVVWSVWLAI